MEVERAIVDLYRTFMMKDHIGERFEGTVTAVVGSGLFVQLDKPFVDVMVRLEDLGQDRYEVDDDALRVVATRSGDVIALGDRLLVEVIDAAILRRTVYARRVGGESGDGKRRPTKRDMPQGKGRPGQGGPGQGRPGQKGRPGDKRGDKGKGGKPERPGSRDKKGVKGKKGRRR
jgi:ribonuclease R